MKTTWNPDLYLRFKKERTQPSIDLVTRIESNKPKRIIDIGCGPGNSTEILRDRWKRAEIIGLDNSKQMIEKAEESYPRGKWILADASDFDPDESFDIVFSNAALQWMPNHERLIPHLLSLVSPGGVLAFQVPNNQKSDIHQSLYEATLEPRFREYTDRVKHILNYQSGPYYYDLLSPKVTNLEMWETTYYHILDNHEELLNWYKSTGMRPYLEALPDNLVEDFVDSVRGKCKERYTVQSDGKVIYPFNRLFAVAYAG
jgi:trans-aconitate 2-methyltransferase